MQPPNILITNYCNQNCSFCFAAKEMADTTIDREMELKNFEKILKKMRNKNLRIDMVKLLGGEPTLHSQFEDIIKLSLKHFPYVQIFTNGILTENKAKFLKQFFPRVRFTLNVMTPGFLLNKKIRELVLERIKDFCAKTEITLSLTIDPFTDIDLTLKSITNEIIKAVHTFRLGFVNPVAGERNLYDFTDFPKMGEQLYSLVKYIKETGSKARFSFNCGFTRCMFTKQQYDFLMQEGIEILGWGCFGKASSMDINPSLQAFHCFPLSTKHRLSLQSNSLSKLHGEFLLKRYEYWKKIYLSVCQKCPFYDHTPDKCPGLCIAFRMNSC